MIYDRIINQGTINEPEGKPRPEFALPATINWMRALAILIDDMNLNYASCRNHYSNVQTRNMSEIEENTIFEQLFLSLNHLSGLKRLSNAEVSSDFSRIGIIACYYGISNAASAMIAAQSGAFKENHTGTSRIWDLEIAAHGNAIGPFGWRVPTLIKSEYQPIVDRYKDGSVAQLTSTPKSVDDANGALGGYLAGSAKWYASYVEDRVRKSEEFKELKIDNFRTNAAREMRDTALRRKTIGFLHQASRYRGKANYREALFLGHGPNTNTVTAAFCTDMANVLHAFIAMAGAFTAKKLGAELWQEFVLDVKAKKAFSLDIDTVWQ